MSPLFRCEILRPCIGVFVSWTDEGRGRRVVIKLLQFLDGAIRDFLISGEKGQTG